MYTEHILLDDDGVPVRQLLFVTPQLLPQVWPQVRPIFLQHKVLWNEFYTIESFPPLFEKGRLQLWTMNDKDSFLLALVMELLVYPKTKVMNTVFILGEEFQDGLKLFHDVIEMWGWKQGARKSILSGRDGLQRVLKPYGYMKQAVAMSKDISAMKEH